MINNIDSAIRWASARFASCSDSARLDADLLLAHCLDKPRSYLYSWPEQELSDSCWQSYQQLVQRRLEPTPIAYLLGRREFYSLEFATRQQALVPRPETELLVEQALLLIPPQQALRVCDLGTGSGIIAITLKKHRPLAQVHATDIDPACIELARENARKHAVDIEFVESDWYRGLPAASIFDLIVANPPYIAADHPFLKQGDLPAEPSLALTPGVSGLEALRQIIAQAPRHLVVCGYLMLEHGYDQQSDVAELLAENGFGEIRCEYDNNDLPRTSIAKLVENPDSGA
ncbi:MAG: peptide chain release factor N(5)-glutamine methyltransferase [Gammaproteobacteria bacterium]|nr:peptide chain release factor N(5)-glutamine methyltransferase [Gammaproteobacteria bacterium]